MSDEFDYVPALFTVLAGPPEGERTVDGWRVKRLGLVKGPADAGTVYDPAGPEAAGFPARPDGTPVYLVSRADRPEVPVAAVVHHGDTAPVRTQEWGESMMTSSGLAVFHASADTRWIDPAVPVLRRAWAVLHARAAGGDDWLLDTFRAALQDVRADTRDWPLDPVEGDFAEDWLLLPDEAGTGTLIGILISPDGATTVECLDADGNTVAMLLTCDG
ncbi:hypothetical protein [Streptomyces sp. NRRL B-24484]|uniref:hypothetical protein n=1 Tax=Streptomyces sp. NRRL B-24484 TaxID=1463833 RepID=UPI0004C1C483|nr:hypothetical protein [Streptomyces sp. NRRL B-24484]